MGALTITVDTGVITEHIPTLRQIKNNTGIRAPSGAHPVRHSTHSIAHGRHACVTKRPNAIERAVWVIPVVHALREVRSYDSSAQHLVGGVIVDSSLVQHCTDGSVPGPSEIESRGDKVCRLDGVALGVGDVGYVDIGGIYPCDKSVSSNC